MGSQNTQKPFLFTYINVCNLLWNVVDVVVFPRLSYKVLEVEKTDNSFAAKNHLLLWSAYIFELKKKQNINQN